MSTQRNQSRLEEHNVVDKPAVRTAAAKDELMELHTLTQAIAAAADVAAAMASDMVGRYRMDDSGLNGWAGAAAGCAMRKEWRHIAKRIRTLSGKLVRHVG